MIIGVVLNSSYDPLSIVPVNHESAHNKFNLGG